MRRKFNIYTNGEKDIRVYEGEEAPQGFHKGTHYKREPWNKGLTKDDPRVQRNAQNCKNTRLAKGNYVVWNKGLTQEDERVAKNTNNMKATMKERYGVDNITQHLCKQEGYEIWNKGLTKETNESVRKMSDHLKGRNVWNKGLTHNDDRILCRPRPQEEREHLRKVNSSPEVIKKCRDTMRKNNTLYVNANSSFETYVFTKLVEHFGEEDIERQYFDEFRYPYKCDFYIKSKDLFIEVNGHWTHGKLPYNPEDINCVNKLNQWKEKAKTSKFYAQAIYVWTSLDVRKRECAKKNNLNFICVYTKEEFDLIFN